MCGVEAESAVEAAEKAIVSNEVEEDASTITSQVTGAIDW